MRIVVTSLTAIFFSLYKEAIGNSGFSKQQYASGSALFRPGPWSDLETAVFAEAVYSHHLSDSERALSVARYVFLPGDPCSMARQGC